VCPTGDGHEMQGYHLTGPEAVTQTVDDLLDRLDFS
jgi:hypothetical protein